MRRHSRFVSVATGAFMLLAFSPHAVAPASESDKRVLSQTSQQRYDWCKANLLDAYERVGEKDPKWDGIVRRLLMAATELASRKPGRPRNEMFVASKAFAEAQAAGCKDPIIHYGLAMVADATLSPEVAERIKKSGYHPYWKCAALQMASRGKLSLVDEESNNEARRLLKEAMDLLPAVFKDKDLPRAQAIDLMTELGDACLYSRQDRKLLWEATQAALGKERADTGFALNLEGHFWMKYAWDGRSDGFANQVTKDQWKAFRERLEKAADTLEKAWKKEPHVEIADDMIQVAMGQGAPRKVMETWFERAIGLAPDHFGPYSRKLYYLEPKWHGTPEDMLKFGKETLAANHWAGHYRILADVHWALAGYHRDPREYFNRKGVWDDVKAVYDRYLKDYPEADQDRSNFIRMALLSSQWEEADRQVKALKNPIDFGGAEGVRELQALIETKIKEKKTP